VVNRDDFSKWAITDFGNLADTITQKKWLQSNFSSLFFFLSLNILETMHVTNHKKFAKWKFIDNLQ
jgi:hypothetical protein